MVVTMSTSNLGQVFDGITFTPITPTDPTSTDQTLPIHPFTTNGPTKSSIFVSIPHFRDGKRCAATLKNLFDSADHPERVYVGLIEQTDAEHPKEDPTCLEEYCSLLGHAMKEHEAGYIHKGEKQADYDAVMAACPRVGGQIRSVRFHHLGAKGPVYARSFIRKLLGNEEFCMEIDAATEFAQGWDTKAIQQWTMTGNEYAVLSTIPLSKKDRARVESSGEVEVPRQCAIKVGSEGVPLYENHADGKAIGLKRPLLSYAPSSQFAFAKCHYETNVPHDPFAAQLLETERFPRYARLWTRGYDVYTPSENIVYSESITLHPLHQVTGHGNNGERKWPPNDSERHDSHIRMKVLLGIHHGIGSGDASSLGGGTSIGGKISTARANLGIYGLGKRRTMDQLLEFTGVALPTTEASDKHGNDGHACANLVWVPYDSSISPRANFFDGTGKADDLELDPIFPLRTLPDATGGQYDHPFLGNAAWKGPGPSSHGSANTSSNVPYSLAFLLWIGGLYVWYAMFLGNATNRKRASKSKSSKKHKRKDVKLPLSEREIKDV
ncbi:hypothetical protein ACHAW6_006064 [Cyclotella cf. meneghiniana]